MSHYEFTDRFQQIYDKAVALYAKGQRGAESFFSPDEKAFLAANGITPQHMYDYAEDWNASKEPNFGTAIGIELIRRDYFLNVQKGRPSPRKLDESSLPGKTEEVEGIAWLPRIIPKAKAKLRGELPESLMYSCGGDRRFFKTNDIHPTEFLSLVWRNENNDRAIIDWVAARAKAVA